MDIIIYNSFQVVRGKKTAYEIADYLLECPNADAADDDGDGDEEEDAGRSGTSSSRPDAEDCFGLELDEEADERECQQGDSSEAAPLLSQWERKRKGVEDILKSKNIVHSHVNQARLCSIHEFWIGDTDTRYWFCI